MRFEIFKRQNLWTWWLRGENTKGKCYTITKALNLHRSAEECRKEIDLVRGGTNMKTEVVNLEKE